MIVEVAIDGEQPRRYEVSRRDERIVVRAVGETTETSIDWRRPQPAIYSLLVDDASYEVFVAGEADDLAVHLVTRSFRVRALDVRRHRGTADELVTGDGMVKINAPIPGRVARVLVSPGQPVERGDGVVVVEAMKMENELRAPRAGIIGSIEVQEGQGVEGGTLLATIE